MAENWYLVLELEFDPPVEDEARIAARIEEKAKYWAGQFNHFKYGPQYRAYHQALPQIKKDMIGPDNIRKQLAEDACRKTYAPVDERLKTIGRKGSIREDEGEKLAQKLKVTLDVVKKRAAKLGIKWEKGPDVNYQAVYDKYYKTKPQSFDTYDGRKQMLASFGVDNLYDFLFLGTDVTFSNRQNSSCDTLREEARKQKKSRYSKTDNVSGTGSKLCGDCELAFKDEASKKAYDTYLEYVRRKAILDRVKEDAEITGELAAESAEEYIRRLTEVFRDRKLAVEVLTAFCKVERIPYNEGAKKETPNLKVCRCGCINDVSDGRKVCQSCGLELVIRCPKCGAENDANIRVCKCGFPFANIDKAQSLCAMAELSMDALEFPVAKARLEDAERFWPGSSRVAELRRRLSDYEKRVGAEVSKMRDAMKGKRFFEARQQYQQIRKLFTGYADQEMEEAVNRAITEAQNLFRQAQAARAEKDVLELCARAYDVCADLPGVRELMAKYPPSPATGFAVSVNPNTRVNTVSWNTDPRDKSIRYVVIRSDSGWVQHMADGTAIYRGSASSYADKDIEPGRPYYYNVFAERAGICSKGASGKIEEVVNLFEIGSVTAAPGNGSLQLNWGLLPKNAVAEIYQITGTGERLVATSGSDGHLLTGLTNDQLCRYRVALAYQVGGKKQVTRGMVLSGTPTCPPDPIDTLRVKPLSGDQYQASWLDVGGGDVRLFGSTRKPGYKVGDVVALAALEKQMQQLRMTRPDTGSANGGERVCGFRYGGGELLYVAAVVVKSGSAVFGNLARACKDASVNIKSARIINGKIHLFLDPPKDATGFVVLIRHDTFPTGLEDRQTVRAAVSIKQYEYNSAIVIDSVESKKYFFSVFAEFRRDGERDYSPGADYLFDNSPKANITYTVSVQKPLFGAKTLVLEFRADEKSFTLPDLDVVSKVGSAPVFKAAGDLFHSVPGQSVEGSLTVRIPMNSLGKNTYIKVFFHSEADSANCQIRLAPGSKYQIT